MAGEPTTLNLWVLKRLFGAADSIPNRVNKVDAPHVRRCLNAGLAIATIDTLALTEKGKAALKGGA